MAERVEVTETSVHTHDEAKPSLVSNTIAIIGFVIVIVIILWGLFHIASLGSPWLTSLFNKAPATLRVEAPANVTSGTPFALRWNYTTTEKGTYAFLYPCKEGLRFQASGTSGALSSIPCGAAFTVSSTNNTVMLVPHLSGTTSMTLPLTIVFIPSTTSSTQVQGSASVTVNPGAAPSGTPTSTPAQPKPVVHASGPTDLEVRIISISPDGAGGAVAVFDIGNVGLSSSGSYSFSAQLPTADSQLYQSPAQYSLAPGDHMVNTLRFSQAVSGVFSVVVDASKAESTTANNYASQSVSMPYYNTYNTNPQYQYPY